MPKFRNLNQRQALFCQHIAAGLSGVEAFKRVTPGNPRDCDVKAAQMRRKPGVEERIRELMRENGKKSEMTRQEVLQWLSAVIRTSPGEVTKSSSLCQAYEETPDGTIKLRMVDKVVCLQQLARMCAWNSPELLLEIAAGDSLRNYLLELRRQTLGAGGMSSMAGEQASAIIELENGANGEEPRQGAHE